MEQQEHVSCKWTELNARRSIYLSTIKLSVSELLQAQDRFCRQVPSPKGNKDKTLPKP
jgi:hypothetical protein